MVRELPARLRDRPIAARLTGNRILPKQEHSLMDFAALPKLELHLHLDCSLSYAAVSRLDPSITLQEAAFLPEDVKRRLEQRVRAAYGA
jgi:hypothetical protein